MKKILALTLAVVTVLLLVGCQQPKISRGTIEGDDYTNEFLGFTFTKPSTWKYYSDEEIAATVNLSVDKLLGENFKDALENNPSVYDMMVSDKRTGTNINVGYENLSKTLSTRITVEKYVDELKKQLDSVSGMDVTFPTKYDTVKLGNSEFTKVVCRVSVSGASMAQVYYLQKKSGYMAFIIVTVPTGYSVDEIEAMFK